jgi:hypothetical protein
MRQSLIRGLLALRFRCCDSLFDLGPQIARLHRRIPCRPNLRLLFDGLTGLPDVPGESHVGICKLLRLGQKLILKVFPDLKEAPDGTIFGVFFGVARPARANPDITSSLRGKLKRAGWNDAFLFHSWATCDSPA